MPPPKNPYQPYRELHKVKNGPGDQRPTALRVVHDEGLIGNALAGKVYLVTGCSAGLGIETARALHAAGADVYMTVRESKKALGEKAIEQIRFSNPKGSGKLELVFLDLASFESIRAGAADFLKRSQTLNVLICNAGVMMCPYWKTAEGFEMQIGTNHFGHFLLFQLLKERLLASATPEFSSRVVVLSSAVHIHAGVRFEDINFEKDEYNALAAYAQSKSANIYMAEGIERLYGHKNLHAISVHPGIIFETELISRHSQSADGMPNPNDLLDEVKTVHQGAATQVWAAISKYFNNKGGVYLSDCGECEAQKEGESHFAPGYAPWAYDQEAEQKLWRISCDAVGVSSAE